MSRRPQSMYGSMDYAGGPAGLTREDLDELENQRAQDAELQLEADRAWDERNLYYPDED